MAQATRDKVINELDTLQLEELDQLEQAIQERRAATEAAQKQTAFHQALFAGGRFALGAELVHRKLT